MVCCYRYPSRLPDLTFGDCQFGADEVCTDYESKSYCRWHLPLVAKAAWSEAQKHTFAEALEARLDDLDERDATADFCGVQFFGAADFSGRTLRGADFRHATLLGNAQFRAVTFDGDASFDDTTFRGEAGFNLATFNAEASFMGAKFKWDAAFLSATFNGPATFREATIDSFAIFDGTRFDDRTSFFGTTFKESAMFESATFNGYASFDSATFDKAAHFASTTFKELADFASAIFNGPADFTSATFASYAVFDAGNDVRSQRFGKSSWQGATFGGDVSFENREFTTSGDLRVRKFAKAARFHGCTFHEAMVFPQEAAFEDRSSEGAAQAYRTLRLGMEKLSARHDAGMFYALEQASLRNTPGRMKRHEWCLSWLYEKCSDYGRNAWRPVWLLLLVAALVIPGYALAALFATFLAGNPFPNFFTLLGRSTVFSMQQVMQPLWVWRDPMTTVLIDGDGKSPLWLALLATPQSLLTISLVSLSFLALRWRFKRE